MKFEAKERQKHRTGIVLPYSEMLKDALDQGFKCIPDEQLSSEHQAKIAEYEDKLVVICKDLLWYRKTRLGQDNWKQALPQTLFDLMFQWERQAVLVAFDEFFKKWQDELHANK